MCQKGKSYGSYYFDTLLHQSNLFNGNELFSYCSDVGFSGS